VTVIILTKNEELFIQRCIESASWADEVLVLDSLSTDRTRDIAREAGATVYEQEWLGWIGQKERAIALARNDWIFSLDADEIITDQLADSIRRAFRGTPSPLDGYVVERRDEFFGKILPNTKRRKLRKSFIRLFNRRFSRFNPETIINETVLFPGQTVALNGPLLHWRNTIFTAQMYKAVENASLEAELLSRRGVRARGYHLLQWPLLRFLWLYIGGGFFRLGTPGLMQAMMRSHAEFLRFAMFWERQNVSRQLDPPPSLYRRVRPGSGRPRQGFISSDTGNLAAGFPVSAPSPKRERA